MIDGHHRSEVEGIIVRVVIHPDRAGPDHSPVFGMRYVDLTISLPSFEGQIGAIAKRSFGPVRDESIGIRVTLFSDEKRKREAAAAVVGSYYPDSRVLKEPFRSAGSDFIERDEQGAVGQNGWIPAVENEVALTYVLGSRERQLSCPSSAHRDPTDTFPGRASSSGRGMDIHVPPVGTVRG